MNGLHVEVVLATAYALFLMVAAGILEIMAQHTHRRAKQYHQRGFTYHPGFDLWECPNGERLTRHSTDPVRRQVRYRAPAKKCNGCALKARCTDSDAGREIIRSTESWLDTEIGRFHRGISIVLLLLSGLIVLAAGARHHRMAEVGILAVVFGGIVGTPFVFARAFWPKRADPVTAQPQVSNPPALISLSPWNSNAPEGSSTEHPFA